MAGRSKTGHFDQLYAKNRLPRLIVSEGIRESLRASSDEGLITSPRHVEFLIDKQGYIRARWLPAENDAWRKIDVLLKQVELLRNEQPRVPAPDEHVR
jgi:putative copper resistance protein D